MKLKSSSSLHTVDMALGHGKQLSLWLYKNNKNKNPKMLGRNSLNFFSRVVVFSSNNNPTTKGSKDKCAKQRE